MTFDTALAEASDARRLWQELEIPYEAARAHVTAASIHTAAGDDCATRLELGAAHSTFERLGARPEATDAARRLSRLPPASGG